MAHTKEYMKLMNSTKWNGKNGIRLAKLKANPLCEECKRKGLVVAATQVHHVVDVESGKNWEQMMALAYSWTNLRSLCRQCHAALHNDRGYHTRGHHQERAKEQIERFKERAKRFGKEDESIDD